MGYYSAVWFACELSEEELISKARELSPDDEFEMETSEAFHYLCFEWHGCKWGYGKETNKFEELLRMKEVVNYSNLGYDTYPFGFIRIGEDTGDIDIWGDPSTFKMYIRSTVEWY